MEEKEYGINWVGLFIKVIVFVIVVLLVIWLISKITRKEKGLSFEENNKKFQDATVEYFEKNLPDKGKSMTVTLNQLINWDYVEKLKNEDGEVCDTKNSKSKIEVVEDYYSIKTVLVCGNKSETTYIKLGNKECNDCDVKVEGLKPIETEEQNKEENTTKTTTNITGENSKGPSIDNTDNQEVNSNQTILYEYVKEQTQYSDWYVGKVTGANIENSQKTISYSKYCKNANNCITDKTDNKNNYSGYKIKNTWNQTVDVYRYKLTILEYKYSNAASLEGYTKTGKTKIAS